MFYNLLKRKNCFVLELLFKKNEYAMIVLFGIRMGRNYTDKCMYEHAKKKPTVFNTGTLSWCNRHEASLSYLIIKKCLMQLVNSNRHIYLQ